MHASDPISPIDDEEHFEFVDYTAASQWERFITTVEEVLNGWGVNDDQLGIFDDSKLSPLSDKPSIKTVEGIDPFVKREIIILDENSYTLSYHYHPIKRWNEFTSRSTSVSSTPEPPYIEMTTWWFALDSTIINRGLLLGAFRFWKNSNDKTARDLFFWKSRTFTCNIGVNDGSQKE